MLCSVCSDLEPSELASGESTPGTASSAGERVSSPERCSRCGALLNDGESWGSVKKKVAQLQRFGITEGGSTLLEPKRQVTEDG